MSEAEERSALGWRCQIVRIREGGELDRALALYVEGLKRRSGCKRIPLAPAIRGLLRIALLQTHSIKKVSRETERQGGKKMKQLSFTVCDPFAPVRELAKKLGAE